MKRLALAALLFLPACHLFPSPPPPPPPPPPECPAECPEGQECLDPAQGCQPKPVKYVELEVRRCADKPTEFCQQGKPMDFGGCIECCLPWEDGWGGWPMVSPELAAWFREKGNCKLLHMRPGPFLAADEAWVAAGGGMRLQWQAQGIGGPYVEVNGKADLSRFNPEFWRYNEVALDDAGAHGMTVEYDADDGWREKNGCPYSPWNAARNIQGEDHCGLRVGDPVKDAWLRQVVLTFGRFANVTWQIGNETRNAGTREQVIAWEQWVAERLRHWEREVGAGVVHMIGTNSGLAEVESAGWIEYVNRHSIQYSPAAGKPTSCNEVNPAPPDYPSQWCHSEHLWAWRSELSRPQWEAALSGIAQAREKGCTQPPPPDCALGTPTARQALAAGMRPKLNVQRTTAGYMSNGIEIEAGKWISATPLACFGRAYYCQPGMNWPDACSVPPCPGPVAPGGHPQRVACEAQFLEAPCPRFSQDHCTGTGVQCPITWDPYIVIGGVNQFHPENVRAGCRESLIVRDQNGNLISGEWWKATAHGKGYLRACNFDGSVCGTSTFEIDQ